VYGTVTVAETGAQWVPTVLCRRWLQSALLQRLDPNRIPGFRLLVEVVLKGRFIWSAEDPGLFLDGEAFGRPRRTEVALSLPSGDGRRGGDFETWFWLVQDPPPLPPPPNPVIPTPVLPNPVLTNPVILNPILGQPVRPLGPGLAPEADEEPAAPAPAGSAGAQRLTDVKGIGRARAALLAGKGINTPADLAAAEPARVAEILGIPEETARTLVEGAKGTPG